MSRTIVLSPEQIEFLKSHQHDMTLQSQADMLGCHVDTLKRLLVRHGIREFEGARYVRLEVVMWTRPCSLCRCTKPRPKWQFRCDPCHDRQSRIEEDPWP